MNAYRITWKRKSATNGAALEVVLSKLGYSHRRDPSGTIFVPAGQGYGDAEDIEEDLQKHLPGVQLTVSPVEDDADAIYK